MSEVAEVVHRVEMTTTLGYFSSGGVSTSEDPASGTLGMDREDGQHIYR